MEVFGRMLEFIELLWPFRRVQQWENAGFYIGGRFIGLLPPGIYPVIPWFFEIKPFNISQGLITTRKLDITLDDKTQLLFIAAADRRVIDGNVALNMIDDFKEQAQELLEATISDAMQTMAPDRLVSGSRKRLQTSLSLAVRKEAAKSGLWIDNVRFLSFVLQARTVRLIMDGNPPIAKEYDA